MGVNFLGTLKLQITNSNKRELVFTNNEFSTQTLLNSLNSIQQYLLIRSLLYSVITFDRILGPISQYLIIQSHAYIFSFNIICTYNNPIIKSYSRGVCDRQFNCTTVVDPFFRHLLNRYRQFSIFKKIYFKRKMWMGYLITNRPSTRWRLTFKIKKSRLLWVLFARRLPSFHQSLKRAGIK